MLATASNRNGSETESSVIHLWPLFPNDPARRVGSPRVLATEGLPLVDISRPNGFNAWAFSPDGRTLALCSEGGTISLVETANGKERTRFQGHGQDVTALAFAPDGRCLASGSRDTTILLWDVTDRLQNGQLRGTLLSAEQLQAYWADLAGTDAGRAGRAIWALASDPTRSMPFLTEQLRTRAEENKKRLVGVPQFIRDLDDDAFAVRENARMELARLGEAAEAAMRQALTKSPTLEKRRSLEQLLKAVEASRVAPTGELLRAVRALEVLEHIGTREALAALKVLTAGVGAESALTLEAGAALERLQRAERR
jgi:hypothetical protein